MTETRSGNKFLAFLGRVFKSNQEEIQAAIEQATLDDKKRESEAAKRKQQETLLTELSEAINLALESLAACTEKTGDSTKEKVDRLKAASKAKLDVQKANNVAFAAREPQPFSVEVKVTGEANVIIESCSTAIDEFSEAKDKSSG